ncbi:MAG TPA: response regulator [Bacteroidales bacterium]|nr:response regulator [Bacteroidales bacterium]
MVQEGIRILFVEDDPSMQTLFSILVKARTAEVFYARDGIAGLKAFEDQRPDLVITDIQMPGMSGMDMLRNIRQIEPSVPCVILSAYTIPEYFIEAIEIGIQGFLIKPLRKDQLLSLLDQQTAAILAERRLRELEARRIAAEEDLRRLNEELEQRVNERTRQLEIEVQERKRAEEELIILNRNLEIRVKEELRKREKQQNLLIQKSKLESMGELAAGMAHEINQPLAGISMTLDNIHFHLASGTPDPSYLERKISVCFEDIERIRHLIDHVRTFSRDQDARIEDRVDVTAVIRNALSLTQTQYRNHKINLLVHLPAEPLYCLGNPFRLEQVLLNLLSNARYAVDEKAAQQKQAAYHREIMVEAIQEGEKIVVEISDNGTGISKSNIGRVFDPFFTTKGQEAGTGLGLSIVYGILKDMGGEISVRSKTGVFTTMTFKLPLYKDKHDR